MAPGCFRWWSCICKTAPGAPHRCGPRGRGAGASQRAPLMACATGTTLLRRVWADAGRGHADAHVQQLPCSEVLQRRLPKDGFEKSRFGLESDDKRTASGAPVMSLGHRACIAGMYLSLAAQRGSVSGVKEAHIRAWQDACQFVAPKKTLLAGAELSTAIESLKNHVGSVEAQVVSTSAFFFPR